MKINEILVEQQLDELGWSDVGRTLGKGLGAVGAVGGAVPGAWDALKHGYQVGRGTVGGVGAPVQAQQAAQWSQQQAALQKKQKQAAATADQQARFAQAAQAGETPAADQTEPTSAANPNAPVGNLPSAGATPAAGASPTAPAANVPATMPANEPGQPSVATSAAQQQQNTIGVRQINKIIPTLGRSGLQNLKKSVDNALAQAAKTPARPTSKVKIPVQTATAVNPAARQGFGAVAESAEVGIYSKFLGKNI